MKRPVPEFSIILNTLRLYAEPLSHEVELFFHAYQNLLLVQIGLIEAVAEAGEEAKVEAGAEAVVEVWAELEANMEAVAVAEDEE